MTKRPAPEATVDALLIGLDQPTRRSIVDDNPELAAAIKYFLEQKANGNPAAQHITSTWFYLHKLRDKFNGPVSTTTVREYARYTLKLDWATGKPL